MHIDYFKIFFLQLWPLWLLLGAFVLIKYILFFLEKQKLSKSGIHEIDRMDGKTFEKYLECLFEGLGYKVERTRYVGDYGGDLVTRKDGIKTVIQAKRHKNRVGVRAIQEAVAAKGFYDCQKAMVVTNSYFTNEARQLANKNDVELWDKKLLSNAMLKMKEKLANVSNENKPDTSNKCTLCGVEVSKEVRKYCLDHPEKFEGNIYCYAHQKDIKSQIK